MQNLHTHKSNLSEEPPQQGIKLFQVYCKHQFYII